MERPNAEVASFALDQLLGFRRAVPVAGRTMNMFTELFDHIDESFMSQFFFAPPPSKIFCFYGKCSKLCEIDFPFCGNPDYLEGSLAAFLPLDDDKLTLTVG